MTFTAIWSTSSTTFWRTNRKNIERRKNGEGNRHSRLGAIKVSIGVNKYALLVYVNMTQNVLCTGLYVFNSYNLAHRVPGDTHRGFIFSGKKLLLQLVKCKLFLTNILPCISDADTEFPKYIGDTKY